jgi:sirohydrochlorin ferrochelatase
VSTPVPPLVIAAHGSADPAFASVVADLAGQIRRARPDLDVRIGYLEHGPPRLVDVIEPGAVVVPLLLSSGYHAAVDIPTQAGGAVIAAAVGPDRSLVPVLATRLRDAGWTAGMPVVLAATGSTEATALQEVRDVGPVLADALGGAAVTVAFVSAGSPRLGDLPPAAAISSYLLARGHYSRVLAQAGAAIVSDPIGPAPELAAAILDRYAETAGRLELVQPGRTAPMKSGRS